MNPYVKSLLKKGLILCGATLSFLLVIEYIAIGMYYRTHFYANTTINGVDCSNLTVKEASEAIQRETRSYTLTMKERGGNTNKLSGEQIGLRYKYQQDTKELLRSQKAFRWLVRAWRDHAIDNAVEVSYDEKKLMDWLHGLDCLKKGSAPKNARISEYNKEKGFTVIKEEEGNMLERTFVEEAVKKAVSHLSGTVSLEKENCYKRPSVRSTSSEITKGMELINRYMKTSLTYEFGDKTEVFGKEQIGPAIMVDSNHQVTLKEGKIKEYVTHLADTYSSGKGSWRFSSSYGKTVTVRGGSYGWMMDEEQELKELMQSIREGKQGKRTAATHKNSVNTSYKSLGKTYVEICKEKQHFFFYKDGKLILESDIVTGIPRGGHDTPAGIYYICQMHRDRVLRGFNDDGSKYSAFVNYWMRFNGGIGLHDASWQSSFGGNRYRYAGSHGCVNLPWKVAKDLYNSLELYTPVVVY